MRLLVLSALFCLASSRSTRPLEATMDSIPVTVGKLVCPHEEMKLLHRAKLDCSNSDFKTLGATKHWTVALKKLIQLILNTDEEGNWYEIQNFSGSAWEFTKEKVMTRSGIYTTAKLGPKIIFFENQEFSNQTTSFVSWFNVSIINMNNTQISTHGAPLRQEDASDFYEVVYCGQQEENGNYELTFLGSFDDEDSGSGLKVYELMKMAIDMARLFGDVMSEYCKSPRDYDEHVLVVRKFVECHLRGGDCPNDAPSEMSDSKQGVSVANPYASKYIVASRRTKLGIITLVFSLICTGSVYYLRTSKNETTEGETQQREPLNEMQNPAFNEADFDQT